MELNLKEKKALVTGGSHGIGLAIVNALKEEGIETRSISRREGFDATVPSTWVKVIQLMPDVDILVNNVGGGGTWAWYDYLKVSEKNINPMVALTMHYVNYMLSKKWGRVITISSIFGKEGGGRPGFAMAKAAQIAFMKNMSCVREYQEANITFNTICPGPIWIEGKEQDKYDRYGQPEDVANLVVFLCSDKARWVNGACITVDGGLSRSF